MRKRKAVEFFELLGLTTLRGLRQRRFTV